MDSSVSFRPLVHTAQYLVRTYAQSTVLFIYKHGHSSLHNTDFHLQQCLYVIYIYVCIIFIRLLPLPIRVLCRDDPLEYSDDRVCECE